MYQAYGIASTYSHAVIKGSVHAILRRNFLPSPSTLHSPAFCGTPPQNTNTPLQTTAAFITARIPPLYENLRTILFPPLPLSLSVFLLRIWNVLRNFYFMPPLTLRCRPCPPELWSGARVQHGSASGFPGHDVARAERLAVRHRHTFTDGQQQPRQRRGGGACFNANTTLHKGKKNVRVRRNEYHHPSK